MEHTRAVATFRGKPARTPPSDRASMNMYTYAVREKGVVQSVAKVVVGMDRTSHRGMAGVLKG